MYAALGQEPPADLTADDIVTNEFIDPSIGLPADLVAATTSGTVARVRPTGTEACTAPTMHGASARPVHSSALSIRLSESSAVT